MQPTELRAVQQDRACSGEQGSAGGLPSSVVGTPTVPTRWSGLLGRTATAAGQEIIATAATVGSLPVRLGGEVVLGLLRRRQRPVPPPPRDEAARPVVLVHGFAASTTSWFALRRALRADGRTVASFEYWPWASSVQGLAHQLNATVEELLAATGADKVHLVGHSLGGVVIAQALTSDRLAGRVDMVVTLGAPFGGTVWAGLLPLTPVVWALRPGSPLLRRLAAAPPPPGVRWLAIAATSDQILAPECAVPVNRGARRLLIEGAGHAGLLVARDVIARIVAETRAMTLGERAGVIAA